MLAFTLTLQAQSTSGVSSDGKDFYIGLMFPSYNKVANPRVEAFWGAFALISSYSDNIVHVSYFDGASGVELPGQRFTIPARTGIQVKLDSAYMRPNDHGDTAEYRSCHITSDQPINIQFFSTGACSGGSYLALATPALGKKYVIASYTDNQGQLGLIGGYLGPTSLEISHGCFEIIAAFDSTKVSITPNATTMGGFPGFRSGVGSTFPIEKSYSVSLHRGQCYFVKSAGEDGDISGSIVTSDKPIAVLGGHENAAIGGVSNRSLEGRDFMIEQMIPVDDWDTTGYVSIPLKDSPPVDPSQYEGTGENYRTYAWDSVGSKINFFDACLSDPIAMAADRLSLPEHERYGVLCPVDVVATNGKKFGVMMYDNRNFATAAPYPAPSMMTIIPTSRWKTSFMWYVPANKFETLQAYYINVICQRGDLDTVIKASYNGGALRPIKQIITGSSQFKNIPNHPELVGQRFQLGPGSYFATGQHPFIIYNYGFRGFDPDFDLGVFDGEDFFFSYANPVGASLSSGDPGKFKVTVDSLCGKWNICVNDERKIDRGIRSVTLLNDPMGIQYSPGKQSINCRFDAAFDPSNFGEVELPGTDSSVCFTVQVTNPTLSAYAPILITDNAGNTKVTELRFSPVSLVLSPANGIITISNATIGVDTCVFLKINNTGKSAQMITSLTLTGSNAFTFDTVPALKPIQPGDSISLKICFITHDTVTATAVINFNTGCFSVPIKLFGAAGTGLILAHNLDLGRVQTDSTICGKIQIDNIGTRFFVLNKNFILSGSNAFTIDTTLFPVVIQPGHSYNATVCFSPKQEGYDTANILWNTDIGSAYIQSGANISKVIGHALPPLSWTSDNQDRTVVCDDSSIIRVWLYNFPTNGTTFHVNQVLLSGQNQAEWFIEGDELGKIPLANFDLLPRDSIWVDVVFKPELNKPLPQKYGARSAQLIAMVNNELNEVVNLSGNVVYAAPVAAPDSIYVVYKGSTETTNFYLTDTGTAPLVLESITPISYPIIDVQNITPGDSIYPGPANGRIIKIDMALTSPPPQDTTIELVFTFKTSCAVSKVIPIHIKYASSGVESISQFSNSFSIRPNPASGNSVLLNFDKPIIESTEVKIFDVLGREVYKRNIFGESSFQIPIRNLQNGIYYAQVNIGGKILTEKFEVQR